LSQLPSSREPKEKSPVSVLAEVVRVDERLSHGVEPFLLGFIDVRLHARLTSAYQLVMPNSQTPQSNEGSW
jgi:hypothetical protein